MAHPLSTDVLEALDRARRQVPGLTVVNSPTCWGHDWITDPDARTVFVRQALSCEWSANLLDALDDLTARCGAQEAPRPRLTLIQGAGEGDLHQPARTGTHSR